MTLKYSGVAPWSMSPRAVAGAKLLQPKTLEMDIDIGPDPPYSYRKYVWGRKTHHHKHNHFPGYNSDQFPQGAFRPYYNRGVYGGFNPNRHYRHMYPKGKGPQGQVYPGKNFLSQSDDLYNKPKVVTVVRNGDKPRNIVKILLNKRSVQSFEQLMSDVSESFGPKWKNNRVRKLFTVRGKEVQSISDFFRNDDLFIAVGTEPLTVNDVADILKEVAPDSSQTKNFKKDFLGDKPRRKKDVERFGEVQEGEREDKRDSGFGETESQRDVEDKEEKGREEVIYIPQKHDPVRKRTKKQREAPPAAETFTDHEKNVVSYLDTERKKAADDDRVRARKRMQKMEEAEKRALDEERRKRGLVPQKGAKDDPYRKMLEEREKERERQREAEKEKARKKKEREERRRRSIEEGEGDEERQRQKEEEERKKKEERKRRMEEKRRREEEMQREIEAEQEERRRLEAKKKKEEEERKRKEAEEARKKEREEEEKRKKEEERRKKEEERLRRIEEEQKIKGANSARPVDTNTDETKKSAEVKKAEPEKKEDETKEEEDAKDSGVGDEVDSSTKDVKKAASPKPRKVEFEEKENSSTSPKRSAKKSDSADKRHKHDKRRDSVKDKDKVDDDNNNNHKVRPPVEKKDNAPRRRSRTHKSKIDRQVSNAERVLDKYEVGKVMGDGNFAVVKACRLKNTNNEYAMKVIDKSKLKGKEHMIENEIEIMKRCTHPNIVRLKEEFETKEEIYLIMELVKGGDLFDAITQSVKFSEKDSAHMVKDLCNALYYLHSRHVVHRDLKPENLLVQRTRDGSLTLKLADFGLAMDVKEAIYTVCGTPTYVAPEILSEIGYGLEVDMWALGVITYILLCGFPPFRSPDRNQTELFEYIKAGEYEFLSPYWDGISRSAKDLIENLLIVDRRRRYKAIDVLTHPWIVTLANTVDLPSNMAEYRLNLRMQLESEAKVAWDTYRLQYHI